MVNNDNYIELFQNQKLYVLLIQNRNIFLIIIHMDWYVVEYLYPNAFKRFTDIMFPNVGVLSISTLGLYDSKRLYQFFDKEGVYLTIEMYNPHQWVCSVSLKNGIVFGPTQDSKSTREETETEGFLECFRILDKKLKGTL